MSWDQDRFLWNVVRMFGYTKQCFLRVIPSRPFKVMFMIRSLKSAMPPEEESEEAVINKEETFKSDECVICLTNSPNVLFCNCGHLCICKQCGKVKS